MGHLIGLGHSSYPPNEAVMAFITSMQEQNFLFELQEADITGIIEYCQFQNLVVDIHDDIVISGPSQVTQNSQSTYTATFIDNDPFGNYIISNHNWELNVLHNQGIYTLATGTTPYYDNTWEVNIGSLPSGYCWIRNYEEKIIGVVKVNAYDNDLTTHDDTYYIYFTDVPPPTTNGYLMQSEIWCGDLTITGTVTVLAGLTLTINPNANITFQNNASLIIQGTLNALDCVLYGGTENWGSIYFLGAASSSSALDNVLVKNSGGIRCYNGANVLIENSTIDHCTEGIYIYNSQPQILNNQIIEPVQNGINADASGKNPLILHNIIKKTSGNPQYKQYQGIILANNTNGYIAHNDINGFYWGIYCGGGSDAYFTDYSHHEFRPDNRFRNNRTGIGAGWGGYILACMPYWSYNSIYNNSSYDVKSYERSHVDADYNWWGSDGAQTYVDGTSYLDVSNPMSYDPWGGLNLPEGQLTENPLDSSDIIIGLLLEREGRIQEAVLHYKNMIKGNVHPGFALTELVGIKNKHSFPNIREYLETLLAGNRPYKPIVLNLLAGILIDGDRYIEAMQLYNLIINGYPNTFHSVNALFEKFFAALNYANDRELAGQLLQELISLNLTDEEYLMRLEIAQNLFNEGGTEYLGKSISNISDNKETELPNEYSLFDNFPNPFNPTTVIKYQIPKEGNVVLKVYDVLGAEVTTLVNEEKSVGRYEVNFDASSLASGVYIYRLNVNDYVATKKMILLR